VIAPTPFAHDRPIAKQARHDLHDIKPIDVSGWIDAGKEGHFTLTDSLEFNPARLGDPFRSVQDLQRD